MLRTELDDFRLNSFQNLGQASKPSKTIPSLLKEKGDESVA